MKRVYRGRAKCKRRPRTRYPRRTREEIDFGSWADNALDPVPTILDALLKSAESYAYARGIGLKR